MKHLMTTYHRLPVAFVKGQGAWLWDNTGIPYLDAISGIAVCGLGHAHPAITTAISEQASQLLHTSNLYQIPHQSQLADTLSELSGMERVFFCNSGAEAVEAALKIARAYGHRQQIEFPHIVVMENSFHGRTLAALSATGNVKVQAGFEPLVPGFIRIPYNDCEALKALASYPSEIVAVLVEPIQGEAGIQIPDPDYLAEIRAICTRHHWLMMLDEIQSGMGRTGYWFAHQRQSIRPDVMVLAKGLANGVPIGACLASGEAAQVFQPGNHGSTFGGNPLACRTAQVVLEVMQQQRLPERAGQLGAYLLQQFREKLRHWPMLKIRGQGLMLAIELDRECSALAQQALAQQLLINVTAQKIIRLLPPLILSDAEADLLVNKLCALINQFMQQADHA